MPPAIAALGCVFLILGLFWLDRDQKIQTSGGLWISVIWLSLACSRSAGQWLEMEAPMDAAQLLEGSPVDRLVYSAILALGIVVVVIRRKQIGRCLRANGPILFFFVYCLVSLFWSDYPGVAFKRWTKAVGDLVMVLIVLTDRDPLAAVKRLLARTSYVLIPLSILLIKYYPALGRTYGYWEGEVQYLGVTTNKNALGTISMCFGLGALWRLLVAYRGGEFAGRTRQMIAQGVILAMVVWLFKMANSMTSISTFLMGSTLLLATGFRAVTRKPVVVHVLIAAMLVVSFSVLFLGISPSALETMGRNPTLTGRTEVWGVLLSLVKNSWVGTGFESFWLGPRLEKIWDVFHWRPNEAHNGYLEVFLNLGWIGVILLVVVITTGYRTVVRAWRTNIPTASLLMAYFFVGLVFNFTESAFFRMQLPAWIFFLLAATSVPAVYYRKIRPTAQNLFQHPGALSREQETVNTVRSAEVHSVRIPL